MAFCKWDYTEIPLIENSQLPSWLEVKVENDKIIFDGKPKKGHEGKYKIVIEAKNNFILREFWITIEKNKNIENPEE